MREEETRKAEQMADPIPSPKSLPAPPPEPQDDELPISLPSDGSGSSTPQHPLPSKAMPTPVSEPSTASQDSDAPSKPGDKTESPKSGGQSGAVAATGTAKQHHRKKDTALELTSETYNGAVMDNYRWAQTITDLEIRIPVSDEVTARDVKVEIRNDYLKVELLKPEHKVWDPSLSPARMECVPVALFLVTAFSGCV